jgi:hypothetical protein
MEHEFQKQSATRFVDKVVTTLSIVRPQDGNNELTTNVIGGLYSQVSVIGVD